MKHHAAPARRRNTKAHLLPMPGRDADAMALHIRLALEAVKRGQAGRHEATLLAQSVLVTGFLTEAGYGCLDMAFIRQAEEDMLALLDHGERTGRWTMPGALITPVTQVINEHDRQLREVRFGALVDANRRLDLLIAASLRKLSM
jgi:hypothetical protein